MSEVLVVNAVRSRTAVVTWYGNCSYRRLKVTYEVRKMVCPLCLHELEDGVYSGGKVFAKDKSVRDYVRDSWLPLVEDGVVVWSAHPEDGGRKPYL
jgi:NMD protein affecting ribosome stability and mRNA decay